MFRNRNNHLSSFDRKMKRFQKVFWILFTLAITAILAIWTILGFGLYTLVTNPDSIGTIAAEVIRPVADVVRGE